VPVTVPENPRESHFTCDPGYRAIRYTCPSPRAAEEPLCRRWRRAIRSILACVQKQKEEEELGNLIFFNLVYSLLRRKKSQSSKAIFRYGWIYHKNYCSQNLVLFVCSKNTSSTVRGLL